MVSLTGSTIQFFRLGPLPYLGSVELVKINSVHLSRRRGKKVEGEEERKGEEKTVATVARRRQKKLEKLFSMRPRIELIN